MVFEIASDSPVCAIFPLSANKVVREANIYLYAITAAIVFSSIPNIPPITISKPPIAHDIITIINTHPSLINGSNVYTTTNNNIVKAASCIIGDAFGIKPLTFNSLSAKPKNVPANIAKIIFIFFPPF